MNTGKSKAHPKGYIESKIYCKYYGQRLLNTEKCVLALRISHTGHKETQELLSNRLHARLYSESEPRLIYYLISGTDQDVIKCADLTFPARSPNDLKVKQND